MNLLSMLKNTWNAFRYSIKTPEIYPVHATPPVDTKDVASQYLKNISEFKEISNEAGASFFCFIQPYNEGSNRDLSSFDLQTNRHNKNSKNTKGISLFDSLNTYYGYLKMNSKQNEEIIDITNVFDRVNGEIYIDHMHNSDVGYELIANKIAEVIQSKQ